MIQIDKTIRQVLNAEFCGDIFLKDEERARLQYRELAKAIHPDLCNHPDAAKAFGKLNRLYSDAERNFQHQLWEKTGFIWYDKDHYVSYETSKRFECGIRYAGVRHVVWAFENGKEKYSDRFFQAVKGIHYRDNKMEELYRKRVPQIQTYQNIHYANLIVPPVRIITAKEESEYPMDLFMYAYGPLLDGRDICWMISRAVDLCCFLYTCGIVHNGIRIENLFIDPTMHTLHLYGGWQYAVKTGEKMTGTTREIYELMPTSARTTGISTSVTDMECVRDIFRGVVKNARDVPKVVREWTERGSGSNPIEEYTQWNLVLDRAYGARQFKPLPVESGKIYGNK